MIQSVICVYQSNQSGNRLDITFVTHTQYGYERESESCIQRRNSEKCLRCFFQLLLYISISRHDIPFDFCRLCSVVIITFYLLFFLLLLFHSFCYFSFYRSHISANNFSAIQCAHTIMPDTCMNELNQQQKKKKKKKQNRCAMQRQESPTNSSTFAKRYVLILKL